MIKKEKNIRIVLAGNVRECRQRAGLSQNTLAEMAGVAYPRISEIERGKVNSKVETIAILARALGVSAAELLAE